MLVLQGNFSDFLTFWAPMGIVVLMWKVGLHGLKRTLRCDQEPSNWDSVSGICTYLGMFLGFFCGGKLTHDILKVFWPTVPHYDKVRWILPCFVGSMLGLAAGVYLGAFLGSFVAFLVRDRIQK